MVAGATFVVASRIEPGAFSDIMASLDEDKSQSRTSSKIVKLNVGGRKFITSQQTLVHGAPNSFFATLLDNHKTGRLPVEVCVSVLPRLHLLTTRHSL